LCRYRENSEQGAARIAAGRRSTRSGDPASPVGGIPYPGGAADNPSSIRVSQLSCGGFGE
jgi:hypothetical protein